MVRLSRVISSHVFQASQLSQSSEKAWPFSMLSGGFPKGALVELSGNLGTGKTELVLKFLAENPKARVAWIENEFTLYPCSLAHYQIPLEKILFIETSNFLWAAHQVLRSQIFDVLVLSAQIQGEIHLRRLQIAAEKSQTTVIFLTESPTQEGKWPIAVQLQIKQKVFNPNEIHFEVLKYRNQK